MFVRKVSWKGRSNDDRRKTELDFVILLSEDRLAVRSGRDCVVSRTVGGEDGRSG